MGIKAIAVATIIVLAVVNVLGVRLGGGLLRWLTALKLGAVLFLMLWAVAFSLGNWSNFTPFVSQRADSSPLLAAFAGGMVAAFFSFGGWWDVTKLAGEIREPATNTTASVDLWRCYRHARLRVDERRLYLSRAVGGSVVG